MALLAIAIPKYYTNVDTSFTNANKFSTSGCNPYCNFMQTSPQFISIHGMYLPPTATISTEITMLV
jgi:hypothetical protein